MNINRKTQIARVIAVQGLTPSEASEQINGRIYEAREYLKCRGQRGATMSATDDLLKEARRDFGLSSYQIGWLNQTIKHAEEKLTRIRSMPLSSEALDAVLLDVVNALRSGRENAEAEAKKNEQYLTGRKS